MANNLNIPITAVGEPVVTTTTITASKLLQSSSVSITMTVTHQMTLSTISSSFNSTTFANSFTSTAVSLGYSAAALSSVAVSDVFIYDAPTASPTPVPTPVPTFLPTSIPTGTPTLRTYDLKV